MRQGVGRRLALALAALLALIFVNYSVAQPLREGLRDLGLEEGKQYALLIRDTAGDQKAVEGFAKALEDDGVDVLFTAGSSVTVTAMKATRLTGLTSQSRDLGPKRLEILKEIVPTMRRVGVFYNPGNPAQGSLGAVRDAAQGLKLQLVELPVRSIDELHARLRALRPGEVDAIFYVGDSMVASQAQTTIAVANAKRLPTMYWEVGTVGMGALASYGVSYRALYVKTAKALGVTIPKAVLDRADEIIQ